MMKPQIPGVVFTLDECEERGRKLARDGFAREHIDRALADRPYAKRRILFFYDEEKEQLGGIDA
jgi:hypothetical protein